ncbi:MAG: FAD-binding oxidoreductase [Gammaproteobacteria bacterium]|nr:FAD-binding oxidoreductase [Gammaproteobacteria bacterium]MDE0513553.1 FAD-binding oxidoreductase [Gammaproteobacteria bacterium]
MIIKHLSRRQFSVLAGRLFAGLTAFFSFGGCSVPSPGNKSFSDLAAKIAGDVITRDHENYTARRRSLTWQLLKTNREPDAIVQAESVNDVINTVKFAGQNGMKVGIRTGGHSWVSSAVRDGGLVLDMSRFRDLEVDAENKMAVVGPAIYARELATVLGRQGLGFPTAHCSTVPMGGYLLGGGQGWNWGSWNGAACNSVLGLDAVTAQGELIRVDEDNYSDLLWAARGSGPGFPAVVTNYRLKLYDLPRAMHMSSYTWPLQDTLAVSEWLPEVGLTLSDKVELFMFLSGLPEPVDGVTKAVNVSAVAFTDTEDEAREILSPLQAARSVAQPFALDEVSPTSFHDLFNLIDVSFPPCRVAADTFYFDLSMREVMEHYVDHFATAPSPMTNVLCEVKPKPIKLYDTAYSMRRLTFLSPYSFWMDEKEDEQNIAWLKRTQEILAPLSAGHFVSEADLEASPERAQRSFSEASWQKIQAVKDKYDPDGVFHTFLGH